MVDAIPGRLDNTAYCRQFEAQRCQFISGNNAALLWKAGADSDFGATVPICKAFL